VIRIRSLEKVFRTGFFMKSSRALNGLDLTVEPGDIYGFVGPNGAGKSTTIKILVGLLRWSVGEVTLLNCSPHDVKVRKRIGYLPEHPYFYDYLSGRELLRYFGSLSGLKGDELKKRIDFALGSVHADKEWIDDPLRHYSKGMIQRVGLAQAILTKPELLILDEPMSGLDPVGRKDVRDTLLALHQAGTTIFYSSHVLSDVESISNRIGIIIDGKMRHEGEINSILEEQAPSYTVRFSDHTQKPDWPNLVVEPDGSLLCHDIETKEKLLSWGSEKGLTIERLEKRRASLEQVLTEEITRV